MNLKEFITIELNGLQAQLAEAFTPPCGERKSGHSYRKTDSKLVCDRCGWNREGHKRMAKSVKNEITKRVDRLEEILKGE